MPEPKISDFNFNDVLTSLSVAFIQEMDNFAAPRAVPKIPVNNLTGNVVTYDKDDWRRVEAEKVGAGSKPPRAGYGIDTDQSYDASNPVKLAKPITKQERLNSEDPVSPMRDAVRFVTNNVMLKRDSDFVSNYFGTGIWGTDLDGSGADFTQWEDSNGTPIRTIANEKDTIQENTGFEPNVLILGPKVWTELKNHDNVIDRIKHTQFGVATKELFAEVLGLDEVIVPEVSEDTSGEGAAASESFMFGKQALLMHRPEDPSLLTPSSGYIFTPRGFAGNEFGIGIRQYELEEEEVTMIEAQLAYDMQVVESELGVFFDNAIA